MIVHVKQILKMYPRNWTKVPKFNLFYNSLNHHNEIYGWTTTLKFYR